MSNPYNWLKCSSTTNLMVFLQFPTHLSSHLLFDTQKWKKNLTTVVTSYLVKCNRLSWNVYKLIIKKKKKLALVSRPEWLIPLHAQCSRDTFCPQHNPDQDKVPTEHEQMNRWIKLWRKFIGAVKLELYISQLFRARGISSALSFGSVCALKPQPETSYFWFTSCSGVHSELNHFLTRVPRPRQFTYQTANVDAIPQKQLHPGVYSSVCLHYASSYCW